MNLSNRTTFITKLIGYLILVAAAIVTAIPLLWLVTSAFKTPNEIFAVPINWYPKLPPNVKSSPYIRSEAYPSVEKPDALDPNVWSNLRGQLETVIWEEAQEHITSSDRMRRYDRTRDIDLRREITEGIWNQLLGGLPSEVWAGTPEDILAEIRVRIIPEAIDGIWDTLYRELALGSVQLQDTDFNEVQGGQLAWERESENVSSVRQYDGTDNGTALSYDLSAERTVQVVAVMQSAIPVDKLRLIRILVRGDASYHHLRLKVESGGKTYRASEPFVLTDSLWHPSVWRLQGEPSKLESDHIVMSSDDQGGAVANQTPQELRLTLQVYRPAYLAICWDKLTHNYRRLWEKVPYNQYFINSVFIATASTLLTLFFCSLGGYAFAKYNFRGKKVLFGILLASMMVPFQVLLVPLFGMMYKFSWLDSYKAIIIPFSIGAFGVFLMRQFIVNIPSELIDAARIDGCSEFGIYYRVVLPIIKPALGALTIYSFLGSWNGYLWPLIILRDESKYTLPLGLANLVSVYQQEYGMLMAGTLLSLLPVIILFLGMQSEFVQGITLGGVKE
jgi:ABC-type glycerol-3-phosphate transport system permease component